MKRYRFPGCETVEPVAFGAFNQRGSLDGVPIVVGGQIVLKDQPLSEVVSALRNVKGNEWEKLSDPWGELAEIRDGGNGKR